MKLGDTTSAIDKKAVTGVKYIYSVKAYTKVNKKNVYSYMDTTGKTATAVPAKATISLEQAGRSINVKINNVKGADGYNIYRKQDSGSFKKIATVRAKSGAAKTYTDTSVSYAKTYVYYIKAYTKTDEKRVYGKASKKITLVTK